MIKAFVVVLAVVFLLAGMGLGWGLAPTSFPAGEKQCLTFQAQRVHALGYYDMGSMELCGYDITVTVPEELNILGPLWDDVLPPILD